MRLSFKIKQNVQLHTLYEYKKLLVDMRIHFVVESQKQGYTTAYVKTFFNPEENEGCVLYEYLHTEDEAAIPPMFFPIADEFLEIAFF
jgi:hypothetical protein